VNFRQEPTAKSSVPDRRAQKMLRFGNTNPATGYVSVHNGSLRKREKTVTEHGHRIPSSMFQPFSGVVRPAPTRMLQKKTIHDYKYIILTNLSYDKIAN
jgi:hypothetical protein